MIFETFPKKFSCPRHEYARRCRQDVKNALHLGWPEIKIPRPRLYRARHVASWRCVVLSKSNVAVGTEREIWTPVSRHWCLFYCRAIKIFPGTNSLQYVALYGIHWANSTRIQYRKGGWGKIRSCIISCQCSVLANGRVQSFHGVCLCVLFVFDSLISQHLLWMDGSSWNGWRYISSSSKSKLSSGKSPTVTSFTRTKPPYFGGHSK